jgi:hypothetical protein
MLMGKSSRRKGDGRAGGGTERSASARRKSADARAENVLRLLDPQVPPAEVAALIGSQFADWTSAGTVAQARLRGGAPVADVAEVLRLLLAGAGDPPGLAVLSFAASVAHVEGDEEAEHRHTAQLLTRAREEGGDDAWLDVVRFISGNGHPGEALDLMEPYLCDHPGEDGPAFTYSVMLREADDLPVPGDRERAALERFADGSGLAEVKAAVKAFMDRTEWGGLITGKADATLDLVPGRRLTAPALEVCASLALEAAVKGTDSTIEGLTPRQLIELYRAGHEPITVLTALAADPGTPAVLARRAADWAGHAHYGLWQMFDPTSRPGTPCLDVASGVRRYVAFPPGDLDGTPRWSVWLGGVIPVDGVWRATGTGIRLSPAEADAMAVAIDKAVEKLIMTTSGGMPLAEMLPPEPVPYGQAPPWGVRWDFFDPLDERYTLTVSSTVMMLAPRLVADVELHRASHPRDAAGPPLPVSAAWLDEPHPALNGLTPRAAAEAAAHDEMLLESLIRQIEYQSDLAGPFARPGVDLPWLRRELGMGGE